LSNPGRRQKIRSKSQTTCLEKSSQRLWRIAKWS